MGYLFSVVYVTKRYILGLFVCLSLSCVLFAQFTPVGLVFFYLVCPRECNTGRFLRQRRKDGTSNFETATKQPY